MKSLYLLFLCVLVPAAAHGAPTGPAGMNPAGLACTNCHTTDKPTKENPALAKCPRVEVGAYYSAEKSPKTIRMDEVAGMYGPVDFSHRAHAEMGEMGGGCLSCHHYNQSRPIMKCDECHSASRVRTDLEKPDLKGARHRLCVDCHLKWRRSSECDSCHAKKGGVAAAKSFPKAAVPKRIVYEVNSVKGGFVTFFHGDHTGRFGLKCADCHKQQSCESCHDSVKVARSPSAAKASRAKRVGPMEELHKPCFSCHAKDSCSMCHAARPAEAFVHGKGTGWKLNRFHSRLSCGKCHTAPGAFARLDPDCESCHPGWQKGFEHKKTGLALTAPHDALGCDSCHSDKNFTQPPSCGSCHPDKTYPKDKPGLSVAGGVKR